MAAELSKEAEKELDELAARLAVALREIVEAAFTAGMEEAAKARPPEKDVEYVAAKLFRDPAVR